MSPHRRNVMVGVVVLLGLAALAWMLIQFAGNAMTVFTPAATPVRFVTDRADGISNGSAVLYRGVNVGRVETITRAPEQTKVNIDALLDRDPPLPGNLRGIIRANGLIGGGAAIVLELTEVEPHGTLRRNQTIECRFVGLDIIPSQFGELATELTMATRQFREANIIKHVDEQVEHVGKLLDSIQSLVDDPKLREDLRVALANIRSTTEKLDKFSGELQKKTNETADAVTSTAKDLSARLEQMAKILEQVHAVAEKINKGQGTVGALVNDGKLYQALVDTALEMKATVSDLRRLVEQWEQEGVPIKVK